MQKVDQLVMRHKRIILFAMNVEHSNLLATCLQARNVNAFSITSDTESSQRRKLKREKKNYWKNQRKKKLILMMIILHKE